MKARIITKENFDKKLLCFAFPQEYKERVSAAAESFGAECIYTEDPLTLICELLGEGTAAPDKDFPAPDSPCLLISGFERGELYSLLDRLKEDGVRLPLKAVCTPHNRSWSFSHLVTELKAEHEYMTNIKNGGRS